MPTIMAGVNQTLMLPFYGGHCLDDCVGGLGQMVLRGIGRLDMGCHRWRRRIVILAIISIA
ncbi:glycine betaine/L-proline transport system permease ProW [Escherichia coli]|uniref:Glycine betaine/L-proline transport system permease ProW n=1 Tax=Escherichia coli TaxID=562 RepID=A0A376NV19_ECOLX|nr:glycine betaine/L-proline transport system permease ProW [Escherichia coli]